MSEEEISESKDQKEQSKPENTTAKGVKAVGVITIIIGIIAALVLNGEATSGYGSSDTYLQTLAVVSLTSGILTGSLFIGISEIIKQLFKINDKLSTQS